MLLSEALKRTPDDHPDHGPLERATALIKEAAMFNNEMIRDRENREKIEEIESEEKTRQCGYFLALGAGETTPSPRQNTSVPDTKRTPDLDIAALHQKLLETETITDVPIDHVVEVACRAAESPSRHAAAAAAATELRPRRRPRACACACSHAW